MKLNEFHDSYFQSSDNTKLYRRSWGVPKKGLIVLVHGFGDHLGRYQFLVKALTEHGFKVEGFDSRGHGRSEGIRGHIDSFEQYIEDLHTFIQLVHEEASSKLPMFLLGHSQGGHIALRYGIQHSHAPLFGIITSSPFLGIKVKVPTWLKLASTFLSQVVPTFAQPVDLNLDHLTHDQTVVEETSRDTLYGTKASVRWYTESVQAMEETKSRSGRFQYPILMQCAGEELIVDLAESNKVFQKLGSNDKRLIEYPGYYHEIYNETPDRRGPVFADLLNWIDEHIPSLP